MRFELGTNYKLVGLEFKSKLELKQIYDHNIIQSKNNRSLELKTRAELVLLKSESVKVTVKIKIVVRIRVQGRIVTVTDGARVKFELSFQIRAKGRARIKLRYIIRSEA